MKKIYFSISLIITIFIILTEFDAISTSKIVRFRNPSVGGWRIDWCLEWSKQCGKPAADKFCQKKGFSHASDFKIAKNIGRTRVLIGGQVCKKRFCDGFTYIDCARMAGRTGRQDKVKGCKFRYCPMCRRSVVLMERAVDPACQRCLNRNSANIRKCNEVH